MRKELENIIQKQVRNEDAYSRKGRREIPLYKTNDSKISYENYQLQWMMDHGYSLRDLMQSMDEYYDDKYIYIIGKTFDDLFTEWKNESGFNQELSRKGRREIPLYKTNDSKISYENYQLQWMMDHGYSLRDLMQSMDEYYDDKYIYIIGKTFDDLFTEWKNESGFNQELWSCKEEAINAGECNDILKEETSDIEKMIEELTEDVMDLSLRQPDGAVHNADTILEDSVRKVDFQTEGISNDILKLYLEAENKEDFKSLFYVMTDMKFENYLLKSKKIMEQNIAESKHLKYKLTEKDEIGDIFHHMKIFNSLYYDASSVPYIKLTDSMDGSDLRKIANVLGIYSIKANEFCISKRKALICNLDFVDIMRIAEHEKYNVETGIIKNSNDECYILTRK